MVDKVTVTIQILPCNIRNVVRSGEVEGVYETCRLEQNSMSFKVGDYAVSGTQALNPGLIFDILPENLFLFSSEISRDFFESGNTLERSIFFPAVNNDRMGNVCEQPNKGCNEQGFEIRVKAIPYSSKSNRFRREQNNGAGHSGYKERLCRFFKKIKDAF